MNTPVFTTEKGCALLAAIDSGLIPEQNGGYDTAPFEKFWSSYMDHLARVYRASGKSAPKSKSKPANQAAEEPGEMLSNHAKSERDERHYYRNLILRSVSAFLIGAILIAFLKAFGLGSFIVCLLLCLSSGLFAITL